MSRRKHPTDELTGRDDSATAVPLPPEPSGHSDDVDRRTIRKSRKEAAKKAKRAVRARYDEVRSARPPGSYPADEILQTAVALYKEGTIPRSGLKSAIFKLEAHIRRALPDLAVKRAPRTLSSRPERVGLMIYETRAVTQQDVRIVSGENHTVVLEEDRVVFVSGLLPGGARPHLFERVLEREGQRRTMAEILLQLSDIWPTLLWMRREQRLSGRGTPISVVMTPFADGLLFGSIDKMEGMPPAGPTAVICTAVGQQTRQLHDFYGDGNGTRLWVMTNTFVDATLLAPDQLLLCKMLRAFLTEFPDIVEENNWRWRIGLGVADPAVAIVAETFKLELPSDERRIAAFASLEAIVASDVWQAVEAATLASQQRSHR